jgi:hypothetical protein
MNFSRQVDNSILPPKNVTVFFLHEFLTFQLKKLCSANKNKIKSRVDQMAIYILKFLVHCYAKLSISFTEYLIFLIFFPNNHRTFLIFFPNILLSLNFLIIFQACSKYYKSLFYKTIKKKLKESF